MSSWIAYWMACDKVSMPNIIKLSVEELNNSDMFTDLHARCHTHREIVMRSLLGLAELIRIIQAASCSGFEMFPDPCLALQIIPLHRPTISSIWGPALACGWPCLNDQCRTQRAGLGQHVPFVCPWPLWPLDGVHWMIPAVSTNQHWSTLLSDWKKPNS